MEYRVIIKNPDGSVGILVPSPKAGITLDEIIAKDVPSGAVHEVVPLGVVPTDRTFRNAWQHDLTVDMPKARVIWEDKLREDRKAVLADLDVDYQRADEAGDQAEKARIAALKTTLRDAPADPRIAAATTPEELKAADVVAEVVAQRVKVTKAVPLG